MQNILNRLISTKEFDVINFGDKVILDEGMSLANKSSRHAPCPLTLSVGPLPMLPHSRCRKLADL